MDVVALGEENFVLIKEVIHWKQCLLAMKDTWEISYDILYGFTTTGGSWEMLIYGSTLFQLVDRMEILIDWCGARG